MKSIATIVLLLVSLSVQAQGVPAVPSPQCVAPDVTSWIRGGSCVISPPATSCLSVSGAVLTQSTTLLSLTNTCERDFDGLLEAEFHVDLAPLSPGVIASASSVENGTQYEIRAEAGSSFVLTAHKDAGCASIEDQSVCF
jgi:hypothetical protein